MNKFIAIAKHAALGLLVVLVFTGCQSGMLSGMKSPESADKPAVASAGDKQTDKARLIESYGKTPMSFEANQGQADSKVKYFARGMGYGLYLTESEVVLALHKADKTNAKDENTPGQTAVLRMQLSGANKHAKLSALDKQGGHINYLKGNDPEKWQKNVPHFAKVKYESVYEGIDLVYYGNQRELEFDFVVKPGADPDAIRMRFTGNEDMSIDADGNLIISTASGDVIHKAPLVYQRVGKDYKFIEGSFVQKGKHEVGFEVASYDAGKELIIDPILVYSTYLGGVGEDLGSAIAVDGAGSAVITGITAALDFPLLNEIQVGHGGGLFDAFVTKLDVAGQIVFSTFMGGGGNDGGRGVAVDTNGNVYVTGQAASNNFPILNAAQAGFSGSTDAFVTKLGVTGQLVYSTYLGGSDYEVGSGIAVDGSGNVYVTGQTNSNNFPILNAAQPQFGGPALPVASRAKWGVSDAFVTKLDVAGQFVYSTYLGGGTYCPPSLGCGGYGQDYGNAIAVDSFGNAYVTGETRSPDFPALNAVQNVNGWQQNSSDAFVTQLDVSGQIAHSFYIGGGFRDVGSSIALDSLGNVYLTGYTSSPNFPTLNAAQSGLAGAGFNAFVTKVDISGNIAYSSYLNGTNNGAGIAVDPIGNAYVTGDTGGNLPTLNAIQGTVAGWTDAFVVKLDALGHISYATYLGGVNPDVGSGIAVDVAGTVFVTGSTGSPNFPTLNAAQGALGSVGNDGFVAKIGAGPVDTDGDGVPDNLDAFPNDPAASVDADGDGHPDAWNTNATPGQIASSFLTLDAFPNDPTASLDSDGDGYPDAWNAGATPAQIAASPLSLDAFPNDPIQWQGAPAYVTYSLAGTNGFFPQSHMVHLGLHDPNQLVQSIIVTGGALSSPATLNYNTNYDLNDGWWNVFDNPVPTTGPLYYTFNVTNKDGTTAKIYSAVSLFVTDTVANVQPADGAIVTTPLNFSWTDPAGTGQQYEVNLHEAGTNRWVWSSGKINTTSVAYNGPLLTPGSYIVRYFLEQQDPIDGGLSSSMVNANISLPDSDGDGVVDAQDAFPNDPTKWQVVLNGSISGTVTNNSGQTGAVMVGLFSDAGFTNMVAGAYADPATGAFIANTNSVGAPPLPDGTYYVGAVVDLNNNAQPDPGEAVGTYADQTSTPIAVTVAGASVPGINIIIPVYVAPPAPLPSGAGIVTASRVVGNTYNYMEIGFDDLWGDFIEYGSMTPGETSTPWQAIGAYAGGNLEPGAPASGTAPNLFDANGEMVMGGSNRFNFTPDGEFAVSYQLDAGNAGSHFIFLSKKGATPTAASIAGTYNHVSTIRSFAFDGVNAFPNTGSNGQFVFNANGTYQFAGVETTQGAATAVNTGVQGFTIDANGTVHTATGSTIMFSANGQYALFFNATPGSNDIGVLVRDAGTLPVNLNGSDGRYIELTSEGVSEVGNMAVNTSGHMLPVIERQFDAFWDPLGNPGPFTCGAPGTPKCTTTLLGVQVNSQPNGILQFTQDTTGRLNTGFVSYDGGLMLADLGDGFDVRVTSPDTQNFIVTGVVTDIGSITVDATGSPVTMAYLSDPTIDPTITPGTQATFPNPGSGIMPTSIDTNGVVNLVHSGSPLPAFEMHTSRDGQLSVGLSASFMPEEVLRASVRAPGMPITQMSEAAGQYFMALFDPNLQFSFSGDLNVLPNAPAELTFPSMPGVTEFLNLSVDANGFVQELHPNGNILTTILPSADGSVAVMDNHGGAYGFMVRNHLNPVSVNNRTFRYWNIFNGGINGLGQTVGVTGNASQVGETGLISFDANGTGVSGLHGVQMNQDLTSCGFGVQGTTDCTMVGQTRVTITGQPAGGAITAALVADSNPAVVYTTASPGYVSESGDIVVVDLGGEMLLLIDTGEQIAAPADAIAPVIALNGGSTMTVAQGSAFVDPGATVTDNVDTGLVASVTGVVDTNVVGTYTLTYNATDTAGNAAIPVTLTVNVTDQTAPVITLNGAANMSIIAGTVFADPGAVVSDNVDQALGVSIAGNVDGNAVGTYTLTYNAIDSAGNSATPVTRTVNVTNQAPGAVFDAVTTNEDNAVIAFVLANDTDADGHSLTIQSVGTAANGTVQNNGLDILYTPNANYSGPDSFTYTATDSYGGTASATVSVTVTPVNDAPVLTLLGSSPVTVEAGSSYIDAGASASDIEDGNISANIVVTSSVNIAVPGTYSVTYDVADSGGLSAPQITRTVQVVDTTVPVISLNGANPLTVAHGSVFTDPGATATDNVGAGLVVSVTGSVDTTVVGTYTLTYNVSDTAGNPAASVTRTVIVADQMVPVIALIGANLLTVAHGSVYADPGVTVSDNVDAGLVASVIDLVDTAVPGTYTVIYNVTDSAGNAAAPVTRTVIVADQTAPVITLNGANPLMVAQGSVYADPGVTVSDNVDTGLVASVTGTVDTNVVGTYTLTYDVSDTAGNAAASVTRTVIVADQTVPVITLIGPNPMTVAQGSVFADPGTTVNDNVDTGLVASVTGAVDTNVVGTYTLTYNVSDNAGNAATSITRTVIVTDQTAPVIALIGPDPMTVAQGSVFADPGTTVSDNVNTGLVASVSGTVDTAVPGTYSLTYDVSDTAGNAAASVTRTVIVADQMAPVIALIGANPLTVAQGSAFADPGATVSDNMDTGLVASVTGVVDTTVVGTYTLTYNVSDNAGNAATSITRTVIVTDQAAPVITLTGLTSITIAAGSTYIDAGATATDNVDVAVTVVVSGAVDIAVPGTYTLTYTATDSAGNASTATRTVVVTDQSAPVITVAGLSNITIAAGSAYVDAGATATDNVDVTVNVVVAGAVDTAVPGIYTLTYTATDSAGNSSTATRTVVVTDQTAPVITVPVATVDPVTGAVTLGVATASDAVDGAVVVTNDAPAVFFVGTTIVTYTATDAAGNTATATQAVVVPDTTAPVITVPVATVDPVTGAVTLGVATATDAVDGAVVVTNDAPTVFPVGTTIVTYTATDAAGNTATATLSVTVAVLNVAALTPAEIALLTPAQLATLTPNQVAALAPVQLGGIIASLTPAQIAALTPVQIAALTPLQLGALLPSLTPLQIAALTPVQIAALTPLQLAAILPTLTPLQIAALTPVQIAALTPLQIAALTPAQVTAIMGGLTPTQAAVLISAQVVGLSEAQMESLPEAIENIVEDLLEEDEGDEDDGKDDDDEKKDKKSKKHDKDNDDD